MGKRKIVNDEDFSPATRSPTKRGPKAKDHSSKQKFTFSQDSHNAMNRQLEKLASAPGVSVNSKGIVKDSSSPLQNLKKASAGNRFSDSFEISGKKTNSSAQQMN